MSEPSVLTNEQFDLLCRSGVDLFSVIERDAVFQIQECEDFNFVLTWALVPVEVTKRRIRWLTLFCPALLGLCGLREVA